MYDLKSLQHFFALYNVQITNYSQKWNCHTVTLSHSGHKHIQPDNNSIAYCIGVWAVKLKLCTFLTLVGLKDSGTIEIMNEN